MKTNTNRVAIPGVLVLTIILVIQMIPTLMPIPSARADGGTDIDIFAYTNSTLDLNVYCSMVNGTIQIWYNGVNLIEEMYQQELSYMQLREAFTIFVTYSAGVQHVKDLEQAFEAFKNVTYQNLDQLYYQDFLMSHFTGLNPANSSIAITILSGNSTLIDEIDLNRQQIDATMEEIITDRLRVIELEDGLVILTNDLETTEEDLVQMMAGVVEQLSGQVEDESEARQLENQELQGAVDTFKAETVEDFSTLAQNDQQLQTNIGTLAAMTGEALAVVKQNIGTVGIAVGGAFVALLVGFGAVYSNMKTRDQKLEGFQDDLFKHVPDIATQIEDGKAEEAAKAEAERKEQEEAAKAEAERRAKEAAEAEKQRKADKDKSDEDRRDRLRKQGIIPCPYCNVIAFKEPAMARHIEKEHPGEEVHPDEPRTEAE